MKSGSDLFNYIQQNDESNALKVVQPGDTTFYLKNSGNYAIHLAAQKGMTQLVKKLLEYGADPYKLNHEDENALSLAYEHDHQHTIIAIYKSDAEVTTDIGSFVLDAVRRNDVSSLRLYFKKAGTAITEEILKAWTYGPKKNSVLHKAVKLGYTEMVEFLINLGMNPEDQNAVGKSAIDIAEKNPDSPIYKIICKKQVRKPIETSPHTFVPTVRGRSSCDRSNYNYSGLTHYLSSKKIDTDNFYTLGCVEEKNEKYYFEESEKSKQYAKDFLKKLWSNPANVKQSIKSQQNKHNKRISVDYKITDLYPSCISFTAAIIDGKEYCFISTSAAKDISFNALKKVTEQFNQSNKKDVEYVLVGGELEDLNEALQFFLGSKYTVKKCAEKYYIKCLTKLFLEYGERLQITGVSNCTFYPFDKNKSYGDHSLDAIAKTVRPYRDCSKLEISDDIYVSLIPCCPQCQTNKEPMLKILKAAQECSKDNLKHEENRSRIELSPLRNSIKTASTLLENNSIFQQKTKWKKSLQRSNQHSETDNVKKSVYECQK